jgi:hypothetical protein
MNAKEAQVLTKQSLKNIEDESKKEVDELLKVIYSQIKEAAEKGNNSVEIFNCLLKNRENVSRIVIIKLQEDGYNTIRDGLNSLLLFW